MDFLEIFSDSPVVLVLFGAIGIFALLIWLNGLLGSFSLVAPLTIGLVVVAVGLSALVWWRHRKPDSN